MIRPPRDHPGYWSFIAHRVSGIGLSVFLPLHFLVLGLALRSDRALDGFLRWTEQPLVRIAETVLVMLLVTHLGCGLRVLALEWLPWSERERGWIGAAFASALVGGLLFLLSTGGAA